MNITQASRTLVKSTERTARQVFYRNFQLKGWNFRDKTSLTYLFIGIHQRSSLVLNFKNAVDLHKAWMHADLIEYYHTLENTTTAWSDTGGTEEV